MKYHINPETGKPGVCRAKIKCRFNVLDEEHYSSKEDAARAYEKQQSIIVEKIDNILKIIKSAGCLDKLEIESSSPCMTGVKLNLSRLRDPDLANNNCAPATLSLGNYLIDLNESTSVPLFDNIKAISVEFEGSEPTFHNAVIIKDFSGDEFVVDITASQWRVPVEFPFVRTKADWLVFTEKSSGIKIRDVEIF